MFRTSVAVVSAALIAASSGAALSDAMKAKEAAFVAIYLVKKKPEMSFEAFRSYQLDTHVPLALSLPGLLDYRLTFFPPDGDTRQAVDAIAQVTFASQEAYQAAMTSPAGERALADLPNMLDMSAVTVLTASSGDDYAAQIKSE